MNLKKKRILALLGVGLISALTSAPTLKDAHASLTAPASYDFGYVWNSSTSAQNYVSSNGTIPTSIALFTRTTDGAYYNYSHTFSNSGSHSNTANYDLPDGLDITMTFNRSNTSWTDASPSYTGYYPTENKIGSDATVGSLRKYNFIFSNYTNNDYRLYLDMSTKGTYSGTRFEIFINTYEYWTYDNYVLTFPLGSFFTIPVLAGTVISIQHIVYAESEYFDAWYLQDLGISDAYDAGYDVGLDDGYIQGQDDADLLVTGFSAMVGILVNFVLMIANLEVLGVSLMGILTIIILFAGIVWTLKLIRG